MAKGSEIEVRAEKMLQITSEAECRKLNPEIGDLLLEAEIILLVFNEKVPTMLPHRAHKKFIYSISVNDTTVPAA
jgi:hypothetical protein